MNVRGGRSLSFFFGFLLDGQDGRRRRSYPAGERLDYCCEEGVSQHKQPPASRLSPLRGPTTHPHLPPPPRPPPLKRGRSTPVSIRKYL